MINMSRRAALKTAAASAVATLAAPAILHAQVKTLKITTWGGKWGEIMKASVLPALVRGPLGHPWDQVNSGHRAEDGWRST